MDNFLDVLEKRGPLTGKELLRELPGDEFGLWAACRRSRDVVSRIVGQRYLRLDRQVEGYARLSPSIMREFLNYTLLGTRSQTGEISRRAEELREKLARISRKKFELAQRVMIQLMGENGEREKIAVGAAFMIAGDVVYGMAHGEPRPESSTGELVKGSDLDIVIVTEGLPAGISGSLEAAIYREKHRLLMNPALREEIDSIIKDVSRVREQLEFQDFKSMVASKILQEAELLCGSRALFDLVKEMLAEKGIPEKIRALEERAALNREEAEAFLIKAPADLPRAEAMRLFHTAEEKEEIF